MNPYVDIYKASETFIPCLSIYVGINRFFIDFYTATSRQTIVSLVAMATDKVVVINELLCFYINRMDVLPRSILNRIILDNFNDEDILSAKDTFIHMFLPL